MVRITPNASQQRPRATDVICKAWRSRGVRWLRWLAGVFMQEWLTMTHYLSEDIVWASRLPDEKPIISKLVVDAEPVAPVRKINPNLCDVIGQKPGDVQTIKPGKMVSKLLPRPALRQLRKLARTIMGRVMEKVGFHEMRAVG